MQNRIEKGFFAAVTEGYSMLSEINAVRTFCNNSETFKIMQKDFSGDYQRKQAFILAMKEANTFSEMLRLIDELTPSVRNSSRVNKLLFKTVVFFGSYVNSDADFMYRLPLLKKEIINYAIDHGYQLDYQPDTSYRR